MTTSVFHFPGFQTPHYTQVPDDAIDVLMPILSHAEFKVLMYVIRRTLGFKREAASISLKQLSEGLRARDGRQLDGGTGLGRSAVASAVASLITKGIITRTQQNDPYYGAVASSYTLRMVGDPLSAVQDGPIRADDSDPRPPSATADRPVSSSLQPPVLSAGRPLSAVADHIHDSTDPQSTNSQGQTGVSPFDQNAAEVWAEARQRLAHLITAPRWETDVRSSFGMRWMEGNRLVVGIESDHQAEQLRKLWPRVQGAMSAPVSELTFVRYSQPDCQEGPESCNPGPSI